MAQTHPVFNHWKTKILAWSKDILGQVLEELRPTPHPGLIKADETIEALITPPVVTRSDDSIRQVQQRIDPDCTDPFVYVNDSNGKFLGVVPIARLFLTGPESLMEALVQPIASISADSSVREAIVPAFETGAAELAVVDQAGRLRGKVSAETLLRLIGDKYGEVLKRFTGILDNSEQALSAIEGQPGRRVIHRIPWLLVGTLGSMLATMVMAGYEQLLKQDVEVAFFIPGLVYLADAIGTQSEAIAVRGLTFSNRPIGKLWWGELQTGVLLGLTLALLIFPFIWIAFNFFLALSVALALVFASSVATSIGLLFPWVLARFGKDPAYGSGPIATIIQDLLSLIIYFLTVSMLI